MIEGCAKLVKMEQALSIGAPVYEFMPGLGDTAAPGFPLEAPGTMPDLSAHCSIMAEVLKGSPSIYDTLKTRKTKKGITLATCIKTGVDDPGLPTAAGMIAGDEESFEVFK